MPIVCNNNTPTENLSKFSYHHLKHISTALPFYLENTLHLLIIMEDVNRNHRFIGDTILATPNVAAPIDEGITAAREMIARGNFFEFSSKYYLQMHGTIIETPFAPTYASIFMERLKKNYLSYSMHKPHT